MSCAIKERNRNDKITPNHAKRKMSFYGLKGTH